LPAIDLARLKKQTAHLSDLFGRPQEFIKALDDVLDLYANRTLRTGKVAGGSVLPTYNAPAPVLRAIQNELAPIAQEWPERAVELAEALWKYGYLESRLLATHLIGQVTPEQARLAERLNDWSEQVRHPAVRTALLTTSLARLRNETPEQFIKLVARWLNPARQKLWYNGLLALMPLIDDPNFDNPPPVFDIVRPALEAAPPLLQNEIADLLTSLYRAFPTETAYFTRQILAGSSNPQTVITFRRMLPQLPEGLQSTLREKLRAAKSTA
jgi:hypothetical protein